MLFSRTFLLANPANLATFVRITLLPLVWLLHTTGVNAWFGASVIVVIFAMDGVDGYLARRFKCVTQFGSFFDLFGDRLTEASLWLFFLFLGLIPPWVLYAVAGRTVIVDLSRYYAFVRGKAPPSGILLRSRTRNWVISYLSRGGYTAVKAALFSSLFLHRELAILIGSVTTYAQWVLVAVVLCFSALRGTVIFIDHGIPMLVFVARRTLATLGVPSSVAPPTAFEARRFQSFYISMLVIDFLVPLLTFAYVVA